ncbi:MAG: coiled-coil [Microgenomates group bacterium GW2011_GWC1_39_12]|nr:MAG: coiled-coil [Microgenomates group bacterium GW2011_GWC1_39_12]
MKKLIAIVFLAGASLCISPFVFAQDICQEQNPCVGKQGDDAVSCYQQVVDSCGKAKETLASQIHSFDTQIQLTTFQIASIKRLIDSLSIEITELENEIERLDLLLLKRLELLVTRIPESYKRSVVPDFGITFLSSSLTDIITRQKYVMFVQKRNAFLYTQLQLTQNNFNDKKKLREDKKARQETAKRDLEQKSLQLTQQKKAKDTLLSQTKGQESVYQSLLADAKAKLAGFASFADSQGTGLLDNQTKCDSWGCYYNQRDNQWGNALINGQGTGCGGACSIARVGCLITSVAMVVSHLGNRDILPKDIAFSGTGNFSVGTAMLMRGSIYVKGKTITRTSISSLNPDVVRDGPVIVGVYYGPFGTHFVVVKGYENGKYIMHDPYENNGSNISFTDKYSLNSIFEVDRVTMN